MGTLTPEDAWGDWTPPQIKKKFIKVYRLPDGTYDAIPDNCDVPAGSVVLDPQPKRKVTGDPHQGTSATMAQLEERYPNKINWGCYYAVRIAKANLTVHSREVRAAMADAGILNDNSGPEHWMGAVFKRLKSEGILQETPHRYKYSSESRGIHEREVKIWALKQGVDTSKYNNKPESVK